MRPFLVLVLVLAALAALLFGVLSFLKEPAPESPTVAGAPADTSPASPHRPVDLEKKPEHPEDRTTAEAKPAENRSTVSESSAGWIYENELSGTVQDPQSRPLQGCDVHLSTAYELVFVGDKIDTSQDRTVRTDANGRFSMRNLEPRSRYKLTLKHKDYTLKEVFTVAVGESGVFDEPPITLTQGATLQGHVQDEGGNNVPGATLVLDSLMYDGADYEPPDRMTTASDNQGSFTFANVPQGQRMLTVTASGYGSVTLNGLNFTGDERMLRDVKLKIGEMIRGRVICAGQGIPGAVVQALGFGNTAQISRGQAAADANGQFTLESLAQGEYNLIARAKGYRFDTSTRQRTGTDNVVIEGFKEADVCGHAVDAATSAPIANFTCRMRTTNGPGMATSATDFSQSFASPAGEFCMNGIPIGEYVVEASAPGYAPSCSPAVSVTRGQSPGGVVVRLTRGGSLSGRIVDAGDKPVSRARITTHDPEWADDGFTQMLGSEFPSAVTEVDVRCGEDGRFLITGLAPGSYQMHIRAAGFTRFMKNQIQVADGEETKLGDVRLSRGGSLRGTLFDPAGKPLVGGTIHVNSDDNENPQTYTAKSGADGKFFVTNIAPGRYLVSAMRGSGTESNPFEQLTDSKNSQRPVTITDDNTAVIELTLSQ